MQFSKEERAMWLEDWKQSGKKAWAYAKENGFIPQTFCSWVKREVKTPSDFVEISKQVKLKDIDRREIRIEKGGISIHIPVAVWTEDSRAIIEGLKAAL